jgi:exodeoxyribonuclease VII large subunit
VKTPTAAADVLVAHLKDVLDTLNDAQQRIVGYSTNKLSAMTYQVSSIATAIPRLFSIVKTRQEARIDSLYNRLLSRMQQRIISDRSRLEGYEQRLPMTIERRITAERHRLEMATEKVKSLDPQLLLQRGYSITLKDGKAIRDPRQLQTGDEVETRVEKGTFKSIIT